MIETLLIWTLWTVVGLIILCSVLPMTRLPHGLVQGPEFIRFQVFLASAAAMPAAAWLLRGPALLWALGILAAAAALNAGFIAKFTPLWRRQSVPPEPGLTDLPARTVTLLTANVKMSNRAYDRFIAMVEREDPDILVTVETDAEWIAGIAPLRARFDARHEVPLDTGYGMLLYAKLRLEQVRVRHLVTEGVPSITAAVQLRSGQWFRLYAVHPEPPVIDHDTKGRDSEIALAGLEARDDPLPAVVTGDLNDVAWSSSTRRFQRLSGLLDPRVGRGFYNTFNAFYPLFRWPLDHLFHDPRFRLVAMRRLEHINSDHFPMLFALALADGNGASDLPPPAEPEEEAEVVEMIEEEKAVDREPIGTDWEKNITT